MIEVSDYKNQKEQVNDIITNLGCSLRTFRLTFSFTSDTRTWQEEVRPLRAIFKNLALFQNLARLDIREKFEIIIGSDYIEAYEAFGRVATSLGFLKQWAIIPDKAANDNAYDQGPSRLRPCALWPRGSSWTWTLQPATASTLTNVPQSLFYWWLTSHKPTRG